MPSIRLICFDLGGVLVRLSKGWHDVCTRANIPHPGDTDAQSWSNHLALLHQLEIGQIDQAEYERQLPTCLPTMQLDHVLRAFDAWLLGLYPGIPDLLSELKNKKIPTAILSNTNPRHWNTVLNGDPQYGCLKLIDQPFASHLLKLSKPDPRIYQAVQKATQIPPENILFFDDLPANIQAATTAGWQARQINPDEPTDIQIRSHLGEFHVL